MKIFSENLKTRHSTYFFILNFKNLFKIHFLSTAKHPKMNIMEFCLKANYQSDQKFVLQC